MSNRKIVVWGATYTNKGSMAMLETLIDIYKDDQVFLVCDHKDDKESCGHKVTPISGLFGLGSYFILFIKLLFYKLSLGYVFREDQFISAFRGTDTFIDLSGFALTEDFSVNSCTYRSSIYLMQAIISKLFSGKYFIFPQAVGPMNRILNKIIFQLILILSDRVYIRGKRSFEFTKKFKFHNAKRTSDIVFMNPYYSKRSSVVGDIAPFILINPNSRIAVKQSKLGSEKYIVELCSMISRLSKNHLVVLTPNEIRQNEEDDLDVCFKIFNRLAIDVRERVTVNENVTIQYLLKLCEDCEYAIVSRFHLMIFCLIKSTLPVVISWSDKYLDIMEEFDISEYVLPEGSFSDFEVSHPEIKSATIKIKKRYGLIHNKMKSEFQC